MNQHFTPNESSFVAEHYKTADHLSIRIQTHENYSQPKIDFAGWILDKVAWSGTETVLDVGCGSGLYVEPALERCQRYIAGDLSPGMLHQLPVGRYDRLNLDAMLLPFSANTFDVILANGLLYHVPDIRGALTQFSRVLRTGGRLIAATNSNAYMIELKEILYLAVAQFGLAQHQDQPIADLVWPFTLENGGPLLAEFFKQVERHDLDSALVFPAVEPVLAYIDSTRDLYLPLLPQGITWPMVLEEIRTLVGDHIREHGFLRVNKLTGTFTCQK